MVDFLPVAAFSLRPSNTTSTGGRSLLVPTPYAIRMALLKALVEATGLEAAVERFPEVRDLQIRLRGPDVVAVNRITQMLLRAFDLPTRHWTRAPVAREYGFYAGALRLALGSTADRFLHETLMPTLPAINYFGRRGGFFQFSGVHLSLAPPSSEAGFVDLCLPLRPDDLGYGILQRMEDMRPNAQFPEVDTIRGDPRSAGARRSYAVRLPYRVMTHGHNAVVYQRLDLAP
ncbi:MAG: hypothetical protein K8J31_09720 [Anaerolineae bacterium]|nr:hypothetical protein [Anaerolineae bacterium]